MEGDGTTYSDIVECPSRDRSSMRGVMGVSMIWFSGFRALNSWETTKKASLRDVDIITLADPVRPPTRITKPNNHQPTDTKRPHRENSLTDRYRHLDTLSTPCTDCCIQSQKPRNKQSGGHIVATELNSSAPIHDSVTITHEVTRAIS